MAMKEWKSSFNLTRSMPLRFTRPSSLAQGEFSVVALCERVGDCQWLKAERKPNVAGHGLKRSWLQFDGESPCLFK